MFTSTCIQVIIFSSILEIKLCRLTIVLHELSFTSAFELYRSSLRQCCIVALGGMLPH